MVSSCLHFRFLSALPQENKIAPLLKCSLIGCQSSRRPLPERKEKKQRKKENKIATSNGPKETNQDKNQGKWERSTPHSGFIPYKELKRAARTLITKKKSPFPLIISSFPFAPPCCCWCCFRTHARVVMELVCSCSCC
jgi:hypothetical protein